MDVNPDVDDSGRGVRRENLSVGNPTHEPVAVGDNAVKNRDLAASLMTPAALNEAQRLAREWDAAHPR